MLDEGKVQIESSKLLLALRANQQKHKAEYETAQRGYREALMGKLRAMLEELELGKQIHLSELGELPKPRSYADEYERVIRMLDMQVSDVVTISEVQFRHYVMDDWEWRHDFTASSAPYKLGLGRR